MPRQGRVQDVYFRHEGKTDVDLYWRIRPQAIRFQQANKGSVTDTLGGYFREVLYSEEEQFNGLLLPDLTIEGETGVAYRKELNTINWIWQHHADLKEDNTPADTWFYDLSDYYSGNSGGGIASAIQAGIDGIELFDSFSVQDALDVAQAVQGINFSNPLSMFQSGDLSGLDPYLDTYNAITNILNERDSIIPLGRQKVQTHAPRAYKIEIMSFSWDDSVSDPMRIRFAFRCKILQDLYWTVNAYQTPDEKLKSINDFSNPVFNDAPIG